MSAFQRAPRPLIGWGGVLLVAVCIVFLLILISIATFAMWRWANGQPIDLMGFAAVLGQATAAGAAVWSLVKNFILTRHGERMEEIRAGVAPASPFAPSPPSGPPSDGVGNTNGLEHQ